MGKLGGRKVAITLLCLAAGVAIDLMTERGLSQNLLYLMLGIIGTYVTGNVISKKFNPTEGAQPQMFDNKVAERVDLIEQYVSALDASVQQTNQNMDNTNKRIAAVATRLSGNAQ